MNSIYIKSQLFFKSGCSTITEGFPRFSIISPDFLMHYPLQPRDSRQASKDAVAAVKEADGKSKAAAKALKAPWAAGGLMKPLGASSQVDYSPSWLCKSKVLFWNLPKKT